MQRAAHRTYTFGEFHLDLARASLFRGADEIKLRPKSFDVLKYLTENQGRLVSKDELIESVWNGTAVTDDSLVQCLKDIRRALGDDAQQIIRTVPRRGYIFEKEVRSNDAALYSEETSGFHLVIEETEQTNGHGESVSGQLQPAITEKSRIGPFKLRKLRVVALVTTLFIIIGGITYGVFILASRTTDPPFKVATIRRLTNDGKTVAAVISPDGKYFAYVKQDGGRESLWVRQIAAVNDVRIGEPTDVGYGGLVFSPDSNFLYYLQGDNLYQTGTLGGSTRKVLEKVGTRITFSPDGKQIAFVRAGQGDGKGSSLVLVNADGSGEEQILVWRKPPETFTVNGCAWSPDGETIICSAGDNPLFGQQFPLAVHVADGSQTPLTTQRWNLVRPAAWLADGSGFVITAFENADSGGQLWHVAYPGGVATRIYSDLNDYRAASLTADGSTLLAVQRSPQLNIHVMSLSGERQSRQLTFGTSGRVGHEGITPAADSSIIFASEEGGSRDLWIMNLDGSGQRQLTFDEPMESSATASPDGRSIVYGVASQGIWRTDLDGGKRRQLTQYGMFPTFSGDGSWVFYTLPRDGWKMWKVPAEGGETVRVTDHPGIQPEVSPDGKLIAYMSTRSQKEPRQYHLHVMPVEGGEPINIFETVLLGQTFDVHWSPDGKAIAYKATENGIQKIVSQPLDGGPPRYLFSTASESEGIAGWGFSRDGKQLYYSTGPLNHNVVVFTFER